MLFVESRLFTGLLPDHLGDEEYRELQVFLMAQPDAGDVIRGSGGIRKVRWAARGKGKSGGIRVIYYWAKDREHIYLLTLYSKGKRADIDPATLKRITKQLELLK